MSEQMTDLEYLTKTWLTYSQDTMCIPADILTDFECGERNAIGLVRPLIAALETEVATLRSLIQMERQQAEQRVQAVERERDIAREQNEQKRTMLQEGADAFYSQERKLDQAEARAEELRRERDRWEWALDYVLGEARAVDLYYDIPEARIGDTADVKRCLLARYDAAHTEEAGDDVGGAR